MPSENACRSSPESNPPALASRDDPDIIRSARQQHCAVCGAAGSVLYSNLHDRLFGAPGSWNIVKCSNPDCRLLWLDPRPLASDLGKAYQGYYTHQDVAGKGIFGAALSKALHLAVDACVALAGLGQERRNVRDLHLARRLPGRLLEIGCGDGSFLQRMARSGWTVQGIDPDPAAIAVAQQKVGACVQAGQLTDVGFAGGQFDAVTMHHVLEHIHDPLETLAEVHRILKPGGVFVCITPNADSWASARFGRAWRGLEPPRHLNIFSLSALREAARRAGFERFTLYSTTVNTWLFFEASFRLARRGDAALATGSKIAMLLRAIAAQFRASLRNRSERTLGEECVLVAEK